MVDGKELGDAGFKYIGVSYSQMDCQAFVEQCLRDCGLEKNLAGSNAWFREVYKNGAIMTPEECVSQLGTVPKGAFLFILEQDGKEPEKYKPDGLGNASHIGLCTRPRGEGAIHSSASRGCVCESKFKNKSISGGWNRVGLWDKVSYDYTDGGSGSGGGGSSPDPEPVVEDPVYKTVFAENGKPVNMRKRPSTKSALVDKVPVGGIVEQQKEDGIWAYIKWNGKYGWMLSCFLVDEDTPLPDIDDEPVAEPDDPTGEILTVWSENGKPVKLRAKPSTSCNLYDSVPCGAQVTLVCAGNEWCKVDYGKRKGWYMMTKFLSRG